MPARQAPTSLNRNGTPWNGPRGSAESAAMARPTSGSGTTTAFSTGLAASMRVIALSASSAGVTSPSATRSRRATASSHPRSLADTGRSLCDPARTPRPNGRRSAPGTPRSTMRCSAAAMSFEPLARNNCVFNWTVPLMPTVKPFTSRPLRCQMYPLPRAAPALGPFAPPGVNDGWAGYACPILGKIGSLVARVAEEAGSVVGLRFGTEEPRFTSESGPRP